MRTWPDRHEHYEGRHKDRPVCTYGHSWVVMGRWAWKGWRFTRLRYEQCWECDLERPL